MNNKGWFTMKDVLNDLAEVSGRRMQKIDSMFAVQGEQPPPINIPDEEDDFLQIYRDIVSEDSTSAEPDLAGIKHMLRMVNDYFDDSTFDDNETIKQLRKNANTVLSISKLNPNVPEFVPKGIWNNGNSTQGILEQTEESRGNAVQRAKEPNEKSSDFQKSIEQNAESINSADIQIILNGDSHIKSSDLGCCIHCKTLVCKDNINCYETDLSHETNNNIDIDINKKVDISELNLQEIKNMRQKLKLKIIDTSKTDSLKKKRERNLAIASLLKLYAKIPTNSTINKPMKLMTPEYFKTAPEQKFKIDVDDDGVNIKAQHSEHNIQNDISGSGSNGKNIKIKKTLDKVNGDLHNTQVMCRSPGTHSHGEESVSSKSKVPDKVIKQRNTAQPFSLEIEESHRNVLNRLNEPKKEKTPVCFLSPVSFKRKGATFAVSPNADMSLKPSCALTPDSFVSTSHKYELPRSGMDRTGSMEDRYCDKTKILITNISLSQETYDQSYESSLSPETRPENEKSDSLNSSTPNRSSEHKNIDHPKSMEIEESIKKVHNWLNKPKKQKQKSTAIFLGPVTFKRKGTVSTSKCVNIEETSSSELITLTTDGSISQPQSVDMPENSSSALKSDSFVPSPYAEELTRSYIERNKVKEARSEDIWTKLERELKKKDMAIKMLEKNEQEVQQYS